MDRMVTSGGRATAAAPSNGKLLPYRAAHAHIADLLIRHDLLLRREIALGHARKPADILGFAAITAQEVERLLSARPAATDSAAPDIEPIDRAVRGLTRAITDRLAKTIEHGAVRLPLLELAERFALTASEIGILVACLAVELDRRYERIYGYLHDDMSRRLPSPGLVLSLYGGQHNDPASARALLNPLATLRHYRLVELLEDGSTSPWLSRPMRIDERIVAFVLGDTAIDARLARYVTRVAGADPPRIGASGRETLDALLRHVRHWTKLASTPGKPLLYLQGARSSGADAVVHAATRALGVSVLVCEAEVLVGETAGVIESVLFLLFREGLLSQSAIYLRSLDRLLEQPSWGSTYRTLLRRIKESRAPVFASGETAWSWPIPPEPIALHARRLQPAGLVEQFDEWRALTRDALTPSELHRLVSLHSLPLGAIGEAWRIAQGLAAAEAEGSAPRIEHVHRACRAQAGTPATSLARRIEPKHDWTDLILPPPQREQLAALSCQARHGSIVYGAWGFDRKLTLGRSLNALFSGPPGTGKTLAAEVIAAELGVEMLKIDLSHIVSKYIGETEKNLRQLFDQAASANAILFFDEADALLGKRSEVKDAHDRYANTETAYLLQKIEEYTGIAILATNLRQNLDEAFTRRMRFIIDFPLPEEADRLRIWQSVWPQQVPLAADVDMPALAKRFRLSGGSIRNVALAAAFLAAEQSEPVTMRHLLCAVRRELQNMGRLVNEEQMDVRRA
jgi:hypothetical protein